MHEYIKIITGCDLRSQLKYLEGLLKKGCLYIGNKNSDATVMCAVTVRRNTSARTVKKRMSVVSVLLLPLLQQSISKAEVWMVHNRFGEYEYTLTQVNMLVLSHWQCHNMSTIRTLHCPRYRGK